jgi:hypothetical protein
MMSACRKLSDDMRLKLNCFEQTIFHCQYTAGSPDKKNGKFWAAQAKRLGGFSKTKKFQNASHLKILMALGFLRCDLPFFRNLDFSKMGAGAHYVMRFLSFGRVLNF